MRKKIKKILLGNKHGFTLVELIISLALISIVLGVAGGFIHFSFKSENVVNDEYEFQADLRQATDNLNSALRDASVTFLMPGSVSEASAVDDWSYLGVSADGSEIVQYVWSEDADGSNGKHTERVIVPSREGITYRLEFNNKEKTKLIGYKLEMSNNKGKSFSVYSTLSAINSVAVDIDTSEKNPAAVVAFRTDERPKAGENKKVTILISMVIDDSGSMKYNLAGTDSDPPENQQRKTIMKAKANALIDSFSDNVYVGVVGFAGEGSVKCDLTKLTSSTVKHQVESYIPTNANGGTNTGDGLRRAYYQLKNYTKSSSDEEVLSYVIILTDGDPTYYSHTSATKYNTYYHETRQDNVIVDTSDYQTADGAMSHQGGTGSSDPVANCLNYTKVIGSSLYVADKTMAPRIFVIGFSGNTSDITKAKNIAGYCNNISISSADINTVYFPADSAESLGIAFDAIKESILTEYWHIYGPGGKPE